MITNAELVARAESKKRKLEAFLRLTVTMDEPSHSCIVEASLLTYVNGISVSLKHDRMEGTPNRHCVNNRVF